MSEQDRPRDDEKNKVKEKDKHAPPLPLPPPGDAPIIVGGGGSTWIWIPKPIYSTRQTFDPATGIPAAIKPDSDTMPPTGQLAAYVALYLPDFTARKVQVHDGADDQGDKDVQDGRNHRTKFKAA